MKLYRTQQGPLVEDHGRWHRLTGFAWNDLVRRDDLPAYLRSALSKSSALGGFVLEASSLLAPIDSQEVWAAGVTYFRSRDARMEEAELAGGGNFYDRVYTADRPELFLKATPRRVVAPNRPVRIRRDSKWNVPEPELTLAVSAGGNIVGYTIGNDMSSRDIEGENPLYLPQAKTYDGCCALGPCILVSDEILPKTTQISLTITRYDEACFTGRTTLAELKRDPRQLVEYLCRESGFPDGCMLMTGTGIIPPSSFTLEPGDTVAITIEPIGTLTNTVEQLPPRQ